MKLMLSMGERKREIERRGKPDNDVFTYAQ